MELRAVYYYGTANSYVIYPGMTVSLKIKIIGCSGTSPTSLARVGNDEFHFSHYIWWWWGHCYTMQHLLPNYKCLFIDKSWRYDCLKRNVVKKICINQTILNFQPKLKRVEFFPFTVEVNIYSKCAPKDKWRTDSQSGKNISSSPFNCRDLTCGSNFKINNKLNSCEGVCRA